MICAFVYGNIADNQKNKLDNLHLFMLKFEENLAKALGNPKELDPLIDAMAILVTEYSLNYEYLITDIRNAFVYNLRNNKYNQSKILAKTGISRTHFRNALKSKLKESKVKFKPSMFSYIINDFMSYCYKENTLSMPTHLFYLQLKKYNNGEITNKDCLDKLKSTGLFHEEKDRVFIKYKKSAQQRTDEQYLNFISSNVARVISNINYNKNLDVKDKTGLFQMAIFSTQIHPKTSIKICEEINDILRDSTQQIITLLSKHELDVPVGTFDEVGCLLMQFNEHLTGDNS